jgi:EAL domain-containing protein (putative c-di-GMP-specific phosphodiesterase class I)
MKNVIYSMKVLQELKALGFNISIDDFGTGHSSLNYLKRFPISELKIDKSFIDNLPNHKDDIAIVKAILALSSNMGYINVAEGIENYEQEEFLRENGCKIGQGFYFCRPLKKDDFINKLIHI